MGNIPEGAQRSEDGYYWWDDQSQQWKPVDEAGQNGAAASGGATQGGSGTTADGGATADGSSAANGGVGTPQAQARQQMGLPESNIDVTEEQRAGYLGQAQIEVHPVDADQCEVVAMEDSGNSNGESVA